MRGAVKYITRSASCGLAYFPANVNMSGPPSVNQDQLVVHLR